MGTNFLLVNVDRREFLDPGTFGDNPKMQGYLDKGHSVAVAALVCKENGLLSHAAAGSWSGNRILVALSTDAPDEPGITTRTAENPERNLFTMALNEFRDISYPAIAMICCWSEEECERFVHYAINEMDRWTSEKLKTEMLWHLGNIVRTERCLALEDMLVRELGPDWRAKYEGACRIRQTLKGF